jgi:Na+/H+ antiporter NhaD/arsenite permease-like protein
MLAGISCLVVFAAMAALMYSRRLSALLALPLMAVALAIIGSVPPSEIINDVIAKGALKLNATYTTTMFGAMLAELLNRLGVAKALVRFVAEFAGDNPFWLGLALTAVTALLFSTLGGLGAVIMVGTITLPVMLSLGISNITAGSLFLFGISLGGMFNIAGWQLYMDVLGVAKDQIIAFVVPFAEIVSMTIVLFLAIELKQRQNLKHAALAFGLLACAFLSASQIMQSQHAAAATPTISRNSITVAAVTGIALLFWAVHRLKKQATDTPAFVLLTPLVPLVLVLVCHWEFIPAFIAGFVFAALGTWKAGSINELNRAIIDGVASVIPAVVLMIGIGMLITAVRNPNVASAIAPILTAVIPTKPLNYILIFTLIAPLSLYRGPLSIWGMGSGIVALMQKATALSSKAIMGMLWSVGQIQGICDPTNTHNIWIATYLGTDTQALLRKTIPYAWLAAAAGLSLSVYLGYV